MDCYMCGHKETSGGIKLLGQYICRNCEEMLTSIDIDEILYDKYKDRIKAIWQLHLLAI